MGCQSLLAVSLSIWFTFSKGVKINLQPIHHSTQPTVLYHMSVYFQLDERLCDLDVLWVCVCACVKLIVSNASLSEYKSSASCVCHGSPVVLRNRKRKRMDWFIVQLTERWRKEGGICFDVIVSQDLPWIFVLLFLCQRFFFFFSTGNDDKQYNTCAGLIFLNLPFMFYIHRLSQTF